MESETVLTLRDKGAVTLLGLPSSPTASWPWMKIHR